MTKIIVKKVKKKIVLEKTSFEPDLNQRPKDIIAKSTVLNETLLIPIWSTHGNGCTLEISPQLLQTERNAYWLWKFVLRSAL